MVSYKEKSLNTLDIPHWCWGTELRLDKRKARKRYNEAKRHVRCESEIEGKKGGERREAGWTEGVEGDRDQAGCRERAGSGGTMTWKSWTGDHTPHWHIWGGTKYPDLFTHTHTDTHKPTWMTAKPHTPVDAHLHTDTKKVSHTHIHTARGFKTKGS